MCSKALEGDATVLLGLQRDVSNERVPLVLTTSSILISLSLHNNTDSVRHVTDTLRPEGLVEADGDSDVFGSHLLLSESLNLSDSSRCSLLEGTNREIRKTELLKTYMW